MKEVDEVVELLVKERYLTKQVANEASINAKQQGISQLDYLYTNDIISRDIVGQAIAEKFGVSYFDLNSQMPEKDKIIKLKQDIAERLRLVLVKADKNTLHFTAEDPTPKLKKQLMASNPKRKIILTFSFSEDIDQALLAYNLPIASRFNQIIESGEKIGPQIVEEIVKEAVLLKASDIHFEPQKNNVAIRIRVDGLLRESGTTDKQFYDFVVNRVKVLCKLRIDEHFGIQDGSMQIMINDNHIDLRVSIVPTVNGEKIVIRILTEYISISSLTDLGMPEVGKLLVENIVKRPHGMIIVTGPNGSGKTTTLYAILHAINTPEKNITTIEDPVEYHVETVNQIQVNPSTELTFARGLRSIVRQDPDIILVGEIRDEETADIAVNAALTGHLLLTTLHANNSATAIPRLLDMGVEPFLLSSTLELLIAQRLVRKICSTCKYSYTYDPEKSNLGKELDELKGINIYAGKGCESCSDSGFKGRIALFEFIEIDKNIEDIILKSPSAEQVWELAKKHGAHSLFQDGIDKIKQGLTTPDEVFKVAEKS